MKIENEMILVRMNSVGVCVCICAGRCGRPPQQQTDEESKEKGVKVLSGYQSIWLRNRVCEGKRNE